MPEVRVDIISEGRYYIGSLDVKDHSTFPLAITHSLGDVKDITKRSGAFTKTFKVPATKRNNRLLNYAYNANIDPAVALPDRKAQVTVDGLPIFLGSIKVKNAIQDNDPKEYELELKGDNLDWVEYLRASSIKDLHYGNITTTDTNLSNNTVTIPESKNSGVHELTADLVNISWKQSYPNWDYVYSLKSYGQFTGRDTNGVGYVKVVDLRPDVYVKAIIDKSFAALGYTIESTFMEQDFFKKLVLAYTGDGFKRSEADVFKQLFNVKTINNPQYKRDSSPIDLDDKKNNILPVYFEFEGNTQDTDFFDNDNNFRVKGETQFPIIESNPLFGSSSNLERWKNLTGYLVPKKMRVKFNVLGRVSGSKGKNVTDVRARIMWYDHSDDAVRILVEQEKVKINEKGNWSAELPVNSPSFHELDENDFVWVEVDVRINNVVRKKNFPKVTISNFEFKNEVQTGNLEGDSINLANTLPDITQLEFLAGIVNMFNLYFKTDVLGKKVTIEPRDEFYQNRGASVDWSQKLDMSKSIVTQYVDTYKRELVYGYKKDNNDKLVKQLSEIGEVELGSFETLLPDRFKPGKQKLGNKVFAYTTRMQDDYISDPGFGPLIPSMWKKDTRPSDPSYDFTPRILRYMGNTLQKLPSGNYAKWRYNGTGTQNISYAIPRAKAEGLLDYGDTNIGLVNCYFRSDIDTLKDGRIISAYFYLTPTDMMNLDLSRPVFVKHHNLRGYYYINKVVDYQPTKVKSTRVELIKVFDNFEKPTGVSNQVTIPVTPGTEPDLGGGNSFADPPTMVQTVPGDIVMAGSPFGTHTYGVGTIATIPGNAYTEGTVLVNGVNNGNGTATVNGAAYADGFVTGAGINSGAGYAQVGNTLTMEGQEVSPGVFAVAGVSDNEGNVTVSGVTEVYAQDVGNGNVYMQTMVTGTLEGSGTQNREGFTGTSTVLNNGSGNWALPNSGAMALGNGNIAAKPGQMVMGNYNVPSTNDIFQIGAGTSNTDRYRGLTFTNDGNFLVQGGYMYTSEGQQVLFNSVKNEQGKTTRFDNLHLKGGVF